jgi:hypothetical protein
MDIKNELIDITASCMLEIVLSLDTINAKAAIPSVA